MAEHIHSVDTRTLVQLIQRTNDRDVHDAYVWRLCAVEPLNFNELVKNQLQCATRSRGPFDDEIWAMTSHVLRYEW